MGLNTLKREGVATWLLVILDSVAVLAVGTSSCTPQRRC